MQTNYAQYSSLHRPSRDRSSLDGGGNILFLVWVCMLKDDISNIEDLAVDVYLWDQRCRRRPPRKDCNCLCNRPDGNSAHPQGMMTKADCKKIPLFNEKYSYCYCK